MVKGKSFDEVTKEEFEAYERVRVSGVVNMFSPQVRDLAGIDKLTHQAIVVHYKELCAKWPDVRDLGGNSMIQNAQKDFEKGKISVGSLKILEGLLKKEKLTDLDYALLASWVPPLISEIRNLWANNEVQKCL